VQRPMIPLMKYLCFGCLMLLSLLAGQLMFALNGTHAGTTSTKGGMYVTYLPFAHRATPALSDYRGVITNEGNLATIRADGSELTLVNTANLTLTFSLAADLAPDGTHLLFSVYNAEADRVDLYHSDNPDLPPILVASNIISSVRPGFVWLANSRHYLYVKEGVLYRGDRTTTSVTPLADDVQRFVLSPDEQSVAVTRGGGHEVEVYLVPLSGDAPVQMTDTPFVLDEVIAWGGTWILLSRNGYPLILSTNGMGERPVAPFQVHPVALSPDGTTVAYGDTERWIHVAPTMTLTHVTQITSTLLFEGVRFPMDTLNTIRFAPDSQALVFGGGIHTQSGTTIDYLGHLSLTETTPRYIRQNAENPIWLPYRASLFYAYPELNPCTQLYRFEGSMTAGNYSGLAVPGCTDHYDWEYAP
jgi:hypothetical protein